MRYVHICADPSPYFLILGYGSASRPPGLNEGSSKILHSPPQPVARLFDYAQGFLNIRGSAAGGQI